MTRDHLSDRRRNQSRTAVWQGHSFEVCVGFYGNDRAGEVFAYGPKTGSVLGAVIEDGCVLSSHLAQRGMTFAGQARAVGRDANGTPASPMGAILAVAAEIESGGPSGQGAPPAQISNGSNRSVSDDDASKGADIGAIATSSAASADQLGGSHG